MSPIQPSAALLIPKISSSEIYQTYLRVFDWTFELPLYLEIGGRYGNENSGRRSDFCLSVNSGGGCCGSCPLRGMPEPERLEPWVWSAPCAAGLHVTLAPIGCGGARYGWLITGHHATGCLPTDGELARCCRDARIPLSDDLLQCFHDVPVLSGSRYQSMKLWLELAGAMIGAEMNSILLVDGPSDTDWARSLKAHLRSRNILSLEPLDDEMEGRFTRETGLSSVEFQQRWKMEEARREIMVGSGTDGEIVSAARRCGCPDHNRFLLLFSRFFFETPREHVRRMRQVERKLWVEAAGQA